MPCPTLHDLARYYRDHRLIGEDRAVITSTIGLIGDASVLWRGYPGTGKTHGAQISVELLPDDILYKVDMLSALGIWAKTEAEAINNARIVYFPEDQNASDNDEVVKVKKKWGDGQAAERVKSTDYGNDAEKTVLHPRTFISTAAITNQAHEKTFDLESARRVIKVNTSAGEAATSAVLSSMADVLVHGEQNVRLLSNGERLKLKKHIRRAMVQNHKKVKAVRFFGAHELLKGIPKTFPEARSAFALFNKVLLGVARWYADEEVFVDKGQVALSPSRVAETWSFYADILIENALKWDTSDREILNGFPQPAWNGDAPTPESCIDISTVMHKLKPAGIVDPAMVKRQISRLVSKGFLSEAEGFRNPRWYRTGLADVANLADWTGVVDACQGLAETYLEGEDLERYLESCRQASGPTGMVNPVTGDVGPITGEDSVLYHDVSTGDYIPIGTKPKSETKKGWFS